jgi:hypothetical protein
MIMSFRRVVAGACFALLLATSALAFTGSVKTLVSTGITTALSAQAQTAITGQDGVTAATIEANFQYGSGGTSVSVLVQTTLDAGTTWRDVARFDFTTATDVRYATLSGLTPKSNTAYVALAAAGVNDGLLGNQFRAVITSVGTYANTTLSVRASLR